MMQSRRILVTGAAGPVGEAVAVAIAPGASHLVLVDDDTDALARTAERARAAAERLDERIPVVLTHPADLSVSGAASDALKAAQGFCGSLDIVVHAPSAVPPTAAHVPGSADTSGHLRAVLERHLVSAVMLASGSLAAMHRLGWGRLVLVGPAAALPADGPGFAPVDVHAAVRGAITALVRSLAPRQDLGGPTVHGVLIGGTMPPESSGAAPPPEAVDTAAVVAFLIGPDGARFNGAVFPVERGHGSSGLP
jgi:NAD(P)-dependent dehydrogenase (short-subunit alcohol dehydrogenase family)